MVILKKLLTSTVALMAALILSPTVILAGGPVGQIQADTQGWRSDIGYGRNIRFFLGLGTPCLGTQVTFKFTDSQPNDYIMTSSGNETVIMDESCGVYAKMASLNLATRSVTAIVKAGDKTYTDPYIPTIKVDFDGQYHTDSAYDNYSYRTSVEDPYKDYRNPTDYPTVKPLPTIQDDIKVWLLNQKADASVNKYGGRTATVKWSAVNIDGYKVLYDIYITESGGKTSIRQSEYGPSAVLYLESDKDYTVKVKACINKVGSCKDSNAIVIPKFENKNGVFVTPSVTPMISVAPEQDQTTDQLNQKINDLQNQLNESKKQQGLLETRLNDLINFIKNLFPLFR
ncbi:hypothetical protein A3H85_00390 [Candidatus Daviesbacteria bacterium RIFCSPLOWO2_02_FULL_40_8]|uniref:Fibronectin type-III domain-containing protein n=1 Tax=Candidatus Daviesbacteria bacterium RIFCSPLOWO2_01_FULL_40_24 TaxID=1797787 RepID=A0A1F5MJX9_9BACT|nr:MAG: hypothetical protein A2780_02055 [Candidatus Daviesbacteria bacterium RIFCSPHIGHO2_01_FULL_41_45]OGE34363.1 MAG: hypothetical protein A3C32_02105 [Candidatus Daviesbacteria bacterium RIFCSPHIGHO2_02_FULL_41_14]OGE65681.1 MAG: hypothetical protein A3B49_03905 [Candidatus Daviesbacteria bacterium RIFCSPLOWO2_01_FULL_40_24]OGE66068.1 MAG: hypothetical protein A3H85_00390 [Candidatus Daviesbacteria bacterium RIFCSPLOWO2_02_FULL_40_8]